MRRIPAPVLAVAAAVIAATGCDDVLDPSGGGNGFTVELVTATYAEAVSGGSLVESRQPAAGVTATVMWRDRVRTGTSDSEGHIRFAGVAPSVTDPAGLQIAAGPDRAAAAVLGWTGPRLVLALPATTPIEVGYAGPVTTAYGQVAGVVDGWSISGIGERSEAHLRWRHTGGVRLGELSEISDLYARNGLDVGSGRVECYCTDAATQACLEDPESEPGDCPCPNGEQVCNDPGGFATGVTAFSFLAAPGVMELGFAERITDYENDDFVGTGRLFYEPAFELPAGSNRLREVLRPTIEPDTGLCGEGTVQRPARIRLQGIDRGYVIRSRGGVEVAFDLVSPDGLRIPILTGNRMAQDRVFAVESNVQQVLLRFPYELTGPLDGFTYGYRVAATSAVAGGDGTAYRAGVRARRPAGIGDPCTVRIAVPTYEAEFLRPTTAVPLASSGERMLEWTGQPAPLRRLSVVDGDGALVAEVWMLDAARVQVPLGPPPALDWRFEPGAYRLRYEAVQLPADGVGAGLLARPTVRVPEWRAAEYSQEHAFAVTGGGS